MNNTAGTIKHDLKFDLTTLGHNPEQGLPSSLSGDEMGTIPVNPSADMLREQGFSLDEGKGVLWHYGANHAADAVVFRHDERGSHILLIERSDTGEWALPGGFVDRNEEPLIAAKREVEEETGLVLESPGKIFFVGKVFDRREAMNAWIETTACYFSISASELEHSDAIRGGDDATSARWVPVNEAFELSLYGSHSELLRLAFS